MNDIEEILKRNPELAIRCTKLVGFRIKRVTNNYTNLTLKDVKLILLYF